MSTVIYNFRAAWERDDADPVAPILGKRAVYTTYEGERLIGTIEAPTRASSGYPIIRFDNGMWGRCDDLIEVED